MAALVAIATVFLVGISFIHRRSQLSDIGARFVQFAAVEHRVVAVYEAGRDKYVKEGISDAEFADIIERDVLPPWRSAHFDTSTLRSAPHEVQQFVRDFEEHHELREQAWQAIAMGLRTGSRQAIERGGERLKQDEVLMEKVNQQMNAMRAQAK